MGSFTDPEVTHVGMRCQRALRMCFLAAAMLPGAPMLIQAQTQFSEVTAAAKINQYTESYGVSSCDITGNGLLDIYVSNHRNRPSLWINQGDGTFKDDAANIRPWVNFPTRDTHGGSCADYDNDGDQDLVVSAGTGNPTQFYENNGNGQLTEKAVELGVDYKKLGGRLPVWLDHNGDNQLDFVMTQFGGVAKLFTQTTAGFTENTTSVGLLCLRFQFGQLFDVDNNGQLDFICPDQPDFPQKIYDTSPPRWTDLTSLFPLVEHVTDSIIGDFDNDGRMDMFLISNALDRPSSVVQANNKTVESRLVGGSKGFNFVSDGSIAFDIFSKIVEVGGTAKIRVGAASVKPASVPFTLDPSDPDVVGLPPEAPVGQGPRIRIGYEPATSRWTTIYQSDPQVSSPEAYFVVTSSAAISSLKATGLWKGDKPGKPTLIMNRDGGYIDNTVNAGMDHNIQCVSATVGDYDNDRDLDLYLACRTGASNLQNRYYDNQGDGTFQLVPNAAGAGGAVGSNITDGAGVADSTISLDYDVDGFLDLFVTNGLNLRPKYTPGGPNMLFRNLGNSNHWIELELTATGSVRDPVGARVTATTDTVSQLRVFGSGYHRWSQEPNRMHFGLGGTDTVDLKVEWPSGKTEDYPNVTGDKLYRITEGSGLSVIDVGGMPPPPPPPPGGGSPECGAASFDPATEAGVFISEDCTTGEWQVRIASGGSSTVVNNIGTFSSTAGFSMVDPFSLETRDILDTTDATQIAFELKMLNAGVDGFDAVTPSSSELCFDLSAPAGTQVYVGSNRVVATPPFDPRSAGACNGGGTPPPTAGDCGPPVTDSSVDRGLFVWKDCAGDDWHMLALAGPGFTVFSGRLSADHDFSSVDPVSMESSDSLDNTPASIIDFVLRVAPPWYDGVDFSVPCSATVNFDASGGQVHVGASRSVVAVPFNLTDYAGCDG